MRLASIFMPKTMFRGTNSNHGFLGFGTGTVVVLKTLAATAHFKVVQPFMI